MTSLQENEELHRHVVSWFRRGADGDGFERWGQYDSASLEGCSVVICTYKRAQSLNRFLDSLLVQEIKPAQLIIVDASPDSETEESIKGRQSLERLADSVVYVRVAGPLKGLTRQRNFGVRLVKTDLVAFFDDDIVLLPGCLQAMVETHRALGEAVVGVGAYIQDQWPGPRALRTLWRLRVLLRMVPQLRPGSYHRSGMPLPWSLLNPTDEVVDGDWLQGGATMWKTATVRQVGFCEALSGYGLAEDLDFSLRARRKGQLVVAGAARLQHLHAPGGRPNHYQLGYMAIYNQYEIHRRALPDRTWLDVSWLIYAWTLDTLLLTRHFLLPSRWNSAACQIGGRLKAGCDILMGR